MKIQDKLIALRKSKGYSQENLAEIIGVSRQSISKWELGEALPDATNLKALSSIYHISIDDLLDDDKSFESSHSFEKDSIRATQKEPDTFDKVGKLAKRHWAKIGYYLLYANIPAFVVITVMKSMSNKMVSPVYDMFNDGFGATFSSQVGSFTVLLVFAQVLTFAFILLGLVLIFIDYQKGKQ